MARKQERCAFEGWDRFPFLADTTHLNLLNIFIFELEYSRDSHRHNWFHHSRKRINADWKKRASKFVDKRKHEMSLRSMFNDIKPDNKSILRQIFDEKTS